MKAKLIPIAAIALLLSAPAALSQDRTQSQAQSQTQARQTLRDREIYGSQLMTRQERNEYRERMRLAKTEQERERIRAEHHERMKERAKQRGVSLPDQPPARGAVGGMGAGPGGGRGR